MRWTVEDPGPASPVGPGRVSIGSEQGGRGLKVSQRLQRMTIVKKRADLFGDGFWILEVVQFNIGLAQEDPFPARVTVEPERFLFLKRGEGQEQDDAIGKGNDPQQGVPSFHSRIPYPVQQR
jgi:hypothetical protein